MAKMTEAQKHLRRLRMEWRAVGRRSPLAWPCNGGCGECVTKCQLRQNDQDVIAAVAATVTRDA